MSIDAYTIAVKLSLVNGLSTGLAAISRQFIGIHGDVGKTNAELAAMEARLKTIGKMTLVGGAMAGVGFGMLGALKAPIEEARAYELAFTKFKTLNLGDAVNQQADKFARSANLMGVSGRELMGTLSESVGLFGNFDEAKKLAPQIAILNKANSAIFGGKLDGIDEGATRSLMKFIDRRGGTKDEATFLRNLNLAEKMVTGSGGFVKFHDLDQFSQMGGTAFRSLSDEGILNMALLLQEQGGAKAGTALMSTYQNLVAGRATKAASSEVVSLGLGKIVEQVIGHVGGRTQSRSRLVLDDAFSEKLRADPAGAIRQFVLPALAAQGVTSEAGILKAVNDMLSNRTASGQVSIMSTQVLQALRDANLAKNAMGAPQVEQAYKDDPNGKFADLEARLHDAMRDMGLVVLPAVIRGVEGLTSGLRWLQDHPTFAMGLTAGFVALGSAMAIGGTLILVTAGFKALSLAIGVGGAGGAGVGGLVGALRGALGPLGLVIGLFATLGLIAADAAKGHEWDRSLNADKGSRNADGTPNKRNFSRRGHWSGAQIPLPEGVEPSTAGGGRGSYINPNNATQTVQVTSVTKLDGKTIAQTVSKHQARQLGSGMSGGGVDSGVALPMPGVN